MVRFLFFVFLLVVLCIPGCSKRTNETVVVPTKWIPLDELSEEDQADLLGPNRVAAPNAEAD